MINGVLKNTARLAQFTISIFRGIDNARTADLNAKTKDAQTVKNRTQRYIRIAGPMGKAFDLEGHQAKFKEQFKGWKGGDVQGLMIDILSPFLVHQQPYEIRLEALEAVSLICQAWPHMFVRQPVIAAFERAFKDKDAKMEQTILNGILAFYETEEARSKSGSDIPVGDGTATGAERLGKSLGVAAHDSAATSLAERFLGDALRISRASLDHLALTATRVIASINRQGLVHPKQCGSALVVLETSPNPFIALEALEQHKDLHMKHESMLGKEYVQAIGQAFAYQRDTIQDVSGVASDGSPKLKSFFGVLKAGSVASRKKFYTDIVKKLDFNPHKSMDKLESQLPYSRFVIENLALVEPSRLDEALHLYAALEKMFIDTGNALSQLLEPVLEAVVQRPEDGQNYLTNPSFNGSSTLSQLTVAAIILKMVSEARSYLRKTWSLPTAGASKAKLISKDAAGKAPSRSASASPDVFLRRIAETCISLHDSIGMISQCRAFTDALSIDNEYKVESDDSGSLTAGEDPDISIAYTDGSPNRKKRKSSASVTPGGRQEKKQRPSLLKRKSSKTTTYAVTDDEDGGEDDWN
jgi:cohesin loading factor subunit SCC2